MTGRPRLSPLCRFEQGELEVGAAVGTDPVCPRHQPGDFLAGFFWLAKTRLAAEASPISWSVVWAQLQQQFALAHALAAHARETNEKNSWTKNENRDSSRRCMFHFLGTDTNYRRQRWRRRWWQRGRDEQKKFTHARKVFGLGMWHLPGK